MDSKTKVCKLLGYSENVKGYKLYDTQSNKVIMRKDVVFNEFQTNFESQHKTSRSRLSNNLQWRNKSSTFLPLPPISAPNLTPPLNVVPLTTRPQDVDNPNNENIINK